MPKDNESSSVLTTLKKRFSSTFSSLKKKKKIKIGFDLGSFALKVVALEPQDKNNTYTLKDARIIELPSKDLDLNSVIKDLDLSDGVNLGICGPNVAVRYVSITRMTEDDFKRALRYEAAQYLPFRIEELTLDGAVLKELPDNYMLVMFAAAKKDFVTKRLKLLRRAHIRVNILDIDSLALINAFNYNFTHLPDETPSTEKNKEISGETREQKHTLSSAVVLLNIGFSVTNINILEAGIPHFSRDINVAGGDLAKEATREAAMANLVSEMRKSFDYYEAGSAAIINKIFLSGGGALPSGVASNLESTLGVKIEQWNPFSKFVFAPGLNKDDIMKNSVQFAVAVGLALC